MAKDFSNLPGSATPKLVYWTESGEEITHSVILSDAKSLMGMTRRYMLDDARSARVSPERFIKEYAEVIAECLNSLSGFVTDGIEAGRCSVLLLPHSEVRSMSLSDHELFKPGGKFHSSLSGNFQVARAEAGAESAYSVGGKKSGNQDGLGKSVNKIVR